MPDQVDIEPLHLAALTEVVAKLKAAPAVAALVPEQVFGPDELARAGEWARCVLVTAGKNYGDRADKRLLVQRDVWVEMRAESQDVLDMLARAVVKSLRGAVGKAGFQNCVHTHSNPSQDGPGYVSRKDVFGLYCKPPKDAEVLSAGAPPKLEAKRPDALPPRLKKPKTEGESNG